MTTIAIIVAAGRGTRAGGELPKQYADAGGAMVLTRTLRAFIAHSAIDHVVAVIHPDDEALYVRAAAPVSGSKLHAPVHGGATRQESVRLGLEAAAELAPSRVLIHDAARPFVEGATIAAVVAALDTHDGAIAALPLSDTLKRAGEGNLIAETIPRAGLWRAQTPQGFRFDAILAAHRAAADSGHDTFTDDAAIAEWAGLATALVEDSSHNVKITTGEDLAMAAATGETDTAEHHTGPALEPRTGTGFDVHRFTEGDHVWLCGVRIPHTHALEGHSDADVALHAITDAILGALGEGDIGEHFPPSDDRWRGASSDTFLADAADRVDRRDGRIVNIDVTLVCEAPRIGPHREAMRETVAGILGIATERVGVKATTSEGLGFTGRGEGIVAMATASLLLPAP
ncbi:MAG: bifunctional 2-C-methyl-D-erythritol 4-phosphate cytidylyltransferase/2-C-methyl-D-erythritol 2,4-cyclodiphosphate synthase [Hyphomicrobiaceae bacterium]